MISCLANNTKNSNAWCVLFTRKSAHARTYFLKKWAIFGRIGSYVIRKGIAKPYSHLYPASSISAQLHPPPSCSVQPPSSCLRHSQRYKNQNIARNGAISPNLVRKIRSCPLYRKIDLHGNLKMVTPNPDLILGIPRPKSTFGQICVEKVKVVCFFWKLAHLTSWRSWFQYFQNSEPRINFWASLGQKKLKLSLLPENWRTWYLGRTDSESGVRFWKFHPQNPVLGKFRLKKSKLSVEDTDLYSDISFLNFKP